MCADPLLQGLASAGLGVGVAAGAEDRDEDHGITSLPGGKVDDGDGLPSIVHEHLLACYVHLPHRHVDHLRLVPVQLAVLAALIAVRVGLPVLLPEELQRDALPPEFLVDVLHVGQGLPAPRL